MFDALSIGATGMQAQQAHVDTIANNLANVNTPGFKKARVSFSELVLDAALPSAGSLRLGAPASLGAGVQLISASRVFAGGELKKTDAPLDLAVMGDGFLELVMPDGTRSFARGGTMKVNADGLLAHASGNPFKPGIAIPDNAEALIVTNTGRVQARMAGQAAPIDLGQLELVRFPNAQGLVVDGTNLYRASDASGEALGGRAGEDGVGTVAQGFLESSNVKLVEEMVDLMVAQRAYEASVKVVQASDEMLGMINGLRR